MRVAEGFESPIKNLQAFNACPEYEFAACRGLNPFPIGTHMATSKTPPPKTFPNTQAGREQARRQAIKQGEKSITFDLRKPAKSK